MSLKAVLFTCLCVVCSIRTQAAYHRRLSRQLDKPISQLLQKDRILIIAALKPVLSQDPTLRKVLQMPKATFDGLRKPSPADILALASSKWLPSLQVWLAENGLSIGMTDEELADYEEHPNSFRYKALTETLLDPRLVQLFEEQLNIYTVLDFLKEIPTLSDLDAFMVKIAPLPQALAQDLAMKPTHLVFVHNGLRSKVDCLKGMDAEFRSKLSEKLARRLADSDILDANDLYNYTDVALWDVIGDMRLISELYHYMHDTGIYDSAKRCENLFG